MSAWTELDQTEEIRAWDRFDARFEFSARTPESRGICEPENSITYSIEHVYGEPERYAELTLDLCHKVLRALRQCTGPGGFVHVLDWQHPCYRFEPHQSFSFLSEDDWPIPPLPNGDFYIFLDPDLRFGVFGHPWRKTMCVFGQPLLAALAEDPPRIFDRPVRIAGRAS